MPRKGLETKIMIKMLFKKIVSLMGYFIINTDFNDILMKVYDNCFDQPISHPVTYNVSGQPVMLPAKETLLLVKEGPLRFHNL